MSRSRTGSASRSRSPIKRRASVEPQESGCPFLIRVFLTKGRHTPMADFDEGKFPIRDEFQVYGWKTSTPTSLIALLYPSLPPPYRSPLARFSFRHIYVDASNRGLYRSKDLVSFTGKDLAATVQPDSKPSGVSMDMELDSTPDSGPGFKGKKVEEQSLDGCGFITGDLISVSLYVPEPRLNAGPNRAPMTGTNGPGGGPAGGFGWGEKVPPPGVREVHPADRDGAWSRGEVLPPRESNGPRRSMGRDGGDGDGRGLGSGRRTDDRGIRGGPRRSPSPPSRNGYGRRSRSPNGRDRRDSYSKR